MTDSQLPAMVENDTFDLSEREDENQILAELQGRSAEKLIYNFNSSGGPVEGLSYAGTRWAAREYSKHGEVLRIVGAPELMVDPADPEYVLVTAQAQRFAVDRETGKEIPLDNAYAVKRRWRKMKLRDGRILEDSFFAEKAWGMAQRNALKALLPTSFVIEVIKRIKSGKLTDVEPSAPRKAPAPRPAAAAPVQKPAGIEEQDRPTFDAPPQETVPAARPATPRAQEAPPKAAPPKQAPAPEQTVSKPATPPPAQQAEAPKQPRDMTVRNMLFMNFKKLLRTEEACRAALKALTGKDKTKDLEDNVVVEFNASIVKCFPNGPYLLAKTSVGYEITEKNGGKIVWPKLAVNKEGDEAPAPTPPAPEEELF